VLTETGRELQPVVQALGVWGIRWISELGDEDLDPKLLLWDMHRNIDHDAVPAGRTGHPARPGTLRRAMPRWFTLSVLAPVSRPAASR
jgi:hypothetical protein